MTDPRFTLPEGTGKPLCVRQVQTSFASLFSEPDPTGSQQMELIFGQGFEVYREESGWALGRVMPLVSPTSRPLYVGWVSLDLLGPVTSKADHFVSVLSAPLFTKPNLKSPIALSVPLGAPVVVGSQDGKYLNIGEDLWLHERHARPQDQPFKAFLDVARLYLGQPYIWGGNGSRGVDCSGLVQMSLAACGIDCPRDADQQEGFLGQPVEFEANDPTPSLQTGDVLFWPGHVGFLSAPNQLLHANATHMSVVEEPLEPALQRMAAAGIELRSVRRL